MSHSAIHVRHCEVVIVTHCAHTQHSNQGLHCALTEMDRLSQVLGLGQDSLLGQLAQQAASARPANGRQSEVPQLTTTPSPLTCAQCPSSIAMPIDGPKLCRLRAGQHVGARWCGCARPAIPAGPAGATQPAGQPSISSVTAAYWQYPRDCRADFILQQATRPGRRRDVLDHA